MESQPQNPEFRINPETFHPCFMSIYTKRVSDFQFIIGVISLLI